MVNKDLLLGIGLGLILAALLITIFPPPQSSFTDLQIINAARELGMSFPGDLPLKGTD